MPTRHRPAPIALAALAAAALAGAPAAAATRIWDGNAIGNTWSWEEGPGGNTNWTHKALIGTPVIANGDSLVFTGRNQLSNRNDYSDLVLGGITFDSAAGAFNLSGNRIELRGDLRNLSSQRQTLAFADLVAGGDHTWDGGAMGLTVQQFQVGNHILNLKGAVDATRSQTALRIGTNGLGGLLINGPSRIESADTWIGELAQGQGRLSLSQGAAFTNTGEFHVGRNGYGELNLESGARLRTTGGAVGANSGSRGVVTLSGTGTRWNATGAPLLMGHGGQQGFLSITDGALMEVDSLVLGNLRGSNGTLNLANGGVIRGLWVGSGDSLESTIEISVGAGSRIHTDVLALTSNNGRLDLNGDGAQIVAQNLIVGGGHSVVTVDHDGASLNAEAISIGRYGNPSGARGAHLVLQRGLIEASGSTHVGQADTASLVVNAGTYNTGQLNIGAYGRVDFNGGTLQATALARADGGQFNWRAGSLRVTNLELGAGQVFGRFLHLPDAGDLRVTGTLALDNALLSAASGTPLSARTIQMQRSQIVLPQLHMAQVGLLRGNGSVMAEIAGAGVNATIVAEGGALTLGDANSSAGFVYDGQLFVGERSQMILLDRDEAHSAGRLYLSDGAVLATVNGLRLAEGASLTLAQGHAQVQGTFGNFGEVEGPRQNGELTFADRVYGPGRFSGRIVFGDDLEASSHTEFGGGQARFSLNSELRMDIGADGLHDHLANLGHLQLDGVLVLHIAADAAPGRYDLADFSTFGGAYRVSVLGMDSRRVDSSRFGIDGTIGVTAVPEPQTWALLAGGLLAVGQRLRLRPRP